MSIDNITPRSPRVTAKGSLIVHTGTSTAEIAIGSNSTYFIANSSASVGINWATANAFTPANPDIIYSSTATAEVADVTISNIPATYSGLILHISGANITTLTDESHLAIIFNNNSASYNWGQNGPGTTNDKGRAQARIKIPWSIVGGSWTASVPGGAGGVAYITIPEYTSTTKYKQMHWWSISSNNPAMGSGNWENTPAITSIKIYPDALVNFKAGVTVTLYGTKA